MSVASITDPEGTSPSSALWPGSPFFGARPEALVLLQLDLNEVHASDVLQAVGIVSRNFADRGGTKLRWQVGLGPTFFERSTGSSPAHRPRALRALHLNGDAAYGLDPGSGESDVLIAIGGEWNSSLDAARELRQLLEESGVVSRAIHVGHEAGSKRGHSGFFDGTSNLQNLAPAQFSECVFVQPEDDELFAGGSYLVFRKYEEDIDMWTNLPDFVQEQLIGRRKKSGCFLNGSTEWIPAAWRVTSPYAHIRRANPRKVPVEHPEHWKEHIYRRSIKFTERRSDRSLRYGLLFIALVRDPETQVARIHNERLLPKEGSTDYFLSSGYIKPLSSACYFLPMDIHLQRTILIIDVEKPGGRSS